MRKILQENYKYIKNLKIYYCKKYNIIIANIKYNKSNGFSFYDKKYLGYEGLISKRMTKINKQNFINNNKKLKDY